MKIVHVSDTHTKHWGLTVPDGDILAFSGDMSYRGYRNEVEDFFKWLNTLPHKYKIVIAGNHDLCFDPERSGEGKKPEWLVQILNAFQVGNNNYYLENEQIMIEGVKFWGSPITPWFHGQYWAFNKVRGEPIKAIWNQIPLDTHVVITHGPIEDVLDKTVYGDVTGCRDLRLKLAEVKPKLHLCGHIHEAYGVQEYDNIKFSNGSVLNEKYLLTNQPNVFEIEV